MQLPWISRVLVYINNKKILLDCGNGITRQMNFPEDFKNLYLILSHLHFDHIGEFGAVVCALKACEKSKLYYGDLKVFIPSFYKDKNDFKYTYMENIAKNEQKVLLSSYDENTESIVNNVNISFLRSFHFPTTYSMKIEKDGITIIYTADTGDKITDRMIAFSENADLLICDSTYLRKHNAKLHHLKAYQAAQIAKEAKVKKLLLTHFLPEENKINYLNEAREIFETADVAREGDIFTLKR